jgi:CRISPR-associated protein Cas5t
MLGLRVTVPIACFRKGLARAYLETEPLPPPATCYGFLLSLVGETQRRRHIGCRVAPVLVDAAVSERRPQISVVLRTVWRVKKMPLGSPGNTRPDYQQLLSPVELVIWLDSTQEADATPSLEQRVHQALEQPASVQRFGGLSLGESTHLVDEVNLLPGRLPERYRQRSGRAFLRADRGRLTLPVWVDHVGSAGTRYVTGDLKPVASVLSEPAVADMPRIDPEGQP